MNPQVVAFLIKCPDQKGIIATLTGFFYKEGSIGPSRSRIESKSCRVRSSR